jgi:magnesium-transporting ATPase (P-type)
MIPISLIISLEIAKMIQGYFISVDYRMFSYIREKFVKANSISLNEELGQVSYVFSDKTGTLTCNRLAFKYCVIGDSCYEYNKNMNNENGQSSSEDEERKKLRELKSIKEIGPRYFEPFSFNLAGKNPSKMFSDTYAQDRLKPNNRMLDLIGTDTGIISEYWKALVVAHECSIEEKDNTYLYRVYLKLYRVFLQMILNFLVVLKNKDSSLSQGITIKGQSIIRIINSLSKF